MSAGNGLSKLDSWRLTRRLGHVNCVQKPVVLVVHLCTVQPSQNPAHRPILEASKPGVEDGYVLGISSTELVRVLHALHDLLEGGQVVVAHKVIGLLVPFALTWLERDGIIADMVSRSALSLGQNGEENE